MIIIPLAMFCLGLLGSPPQPPRQDPAPPPGALALLVTDVDAAAVESIERAIAANDALARAVAARLVGVIGHAPAGDALEAAFAREQDPDAAAEQATALLLLRGASVGGLIEARLPKADYLALPYVAWLAHVAPERLAAAMPAVASSSYPTESLNRIVLDVMKRAPALAETLARARYETATASQWHGFASALQPDQEWAARLLRDAVASANAEIRQGTIWVLIDKVAAGATVPGDLLDVAIDEAPAGGEAGQSAAWEQFGRELLARHHRGVGTPDRSDVIRSRGRDHDVRMLARAEALLTRSEQSQVRNLLGRERYAAARADGVALPAGQTGTPIRLLPVRWPGFLRQVLQAAQCPADRDRKVGLAFVEYGRDGRVTDVALNDNPLPPGCQRATRALARLSFAHVSYSPRDGSSEWLLLPLDGDWVECASDSAATYRDKPAARFEHPTSVGSSRKVRHLDPGYPTSVRRKGVQGAVFLEANITPTGCIVDASVLQSPDPSLSFAALHAVSAWRFTPTKVDGVAIPVIMTVTVNFTFEP